MPIEVKCPGCNVGFRVKDEHAGKKMKCPRCAKIVSIPEKAADDEVIEEVDVVEEEAEEAPAQLFDFDESADPGPQKKRAVQEPARPRGKTWGKYMPCPHCNGREAKKIKWTWWGSFYGPRMFTHVRCIDCGYCFNGKTGDSNLIPAIIFVIVPLVLIIILLGFIYVTLQRTGHWPPWIGWS
jgi:hypothetical protein